MKIYYSLLLNFYERNKPHIHDILFHSGVYLFLLITDVFCSRVWLIDPRLILFGLVILIYSLGYYLSRRYHLKSEFDGLFSHSLEYTVFLGIAVLLFYLIFVRPRMLLRFQ